jgi:large subunit ribosomal protein L1
MGSKRNVTVDGSEDKIKVIATKGTDDTVQEMDDKNQDPDKTVVDSKKKSPPKVNPRSKRYQAARAQIDRSKFYSVQEAIALVKKTTYAKFGGSVSADLVLKDTDNQIKVSFPHATGKTLRVAVVDEALLEKIGAGKIDFDVLLTTPQFMPKLAKLARILGPKGLMPNPKNGTIVSDPEKAKKELEGGKTTLKTERKAPLLHVTLGKVSAKASDLEENLQALLTTLEGRIVKVVITATMAPGIKVLL